MDKAQLIRELNTHYTAFRQLNQSLTEAEYTEVPLAKWSAGQQVDHIRRCVAPVHLAFGMPVFMLRILFGKANRASRNYAELVEKYQRKLAEGGKAGKQYVPGPIAWKNREKLLRRLEKLIRGLAEKIESFNEDQLDQLILPHPLLGKLTLREMLYFSIYHVQHHHQSVLQNLGKPGLNS